MRSPEPHSPRQTADTHPSSGNRTSWLKLGLAAAISLAIALIARALIGSLAILPTVSESTRAAKERVKLAERAEYEVLIEENLKSTARRLEELLADPGTANRPSLHEKLSILQRRAGDPDAARVTLERALAESPNARLHYLLGLTLTDLRRHDEAREHLRASLALEPLPEAQRALDELGPPTT